MTAREMLNELLGKKCRCGSKKSPRKTFCGPCYYLLTADMRRALYRRFGEGYEEAYEQAEKELREKGRIKDAN